MTSRRWVLFASIVTAPLAAAASAVSGCSSSNSATPPEAGVEASTGGDTGVGDDAKPEAEGAAATAKLQWKVVLAIQPTGALDEAGAATEAGASDGSAAEASADGAVVVQPPDAGDGGLVNLAGVEVCVYQNSAIPCVMTDANGEFILPGLPLRTNLAISLHKTGYIPTLRPIATASTDMDDRGNPIGLIPTDAPSPAIGFPIDWQNKGQIRIFTLGQLPDGGSAFVGDRGALIAMTPQSGNGPLYVGQNNQFDLSATSLVDIRAWYYNVDPGTYTLTWTDTNNDCEPLLFPFGLGGYPIPTTKHAIQFPVVAGYITGYVGVVCTPNSVIVKVDAG